jgi:alpha-glucosidase (family GH31 glycosyl hydrolase)
MWGDAFLVHPIRDKKNSDSLTIQLPKNQVWFDFHSGKKLNLSKNDSNFHVLNVVNSFNQIPVFVKAGSFVPMTEQIQSTDEFNPNKVSVHFYFDSKLKKSSGIWYDDDGLTNEAFEKQKYEMINFKFQKNTKKSIITIKKTVGKAYQSKIDSFNLIIHFDNKIPKSIKIGKQVFSSAQFLKNNYLKIPISLNSTDIKITFVD